MPNKSGPGKHYRKGITIMDAVQKFDTEEKAETWFIQQRWPDGVSCPFCESSRIATIANRKPQPFRCKSCRKHFSVKTDTLMHSSNISLSKWAISFYLFATSLKGVSSMKLHRDLGIGQEAAWYMGHRISAASAILALLACVIVCNTKSMRNMEFRLLFSDEYSTSSARRGRVRERDGPHQRAGKPLGAVQARD